MSPGRQLLVEKIHRNSLKSGYKLHWYEIKKVLGQGGFGITYLAFDNNLQTSVAIKEYLPIEMAVREGDYSVHPVTENHSEQFQWGLDRFLSEARTLAQFNHPNIVRVVAVFEGNNTGYMVMSYEEGVSLADKLKNRKTIEEPDLIKLLIPLMGGLEQMHNAGFIHRDIKPDNIFIRNDGSPVLLDFGSARQAMGSQTHTLTSLVTPGYAPFEQYYAKSDEQGPWTDIYGLGATIYRAITGTAPTDAVDRSNALLKRRNDTYITCREFGRDRYSERFLLAIDHALRFNVEDRPQSIAEWRVEFALPDAPLTGATTDHIPTQPGTSFHSPGIDRPVTKQPTLKGQEKPRGKALKAVFLVILVLALAGAGIYYRPQIQQGIDHWQSKQDVDRLLVEARTRLDAKEFTQPEGNNALEIFREVLELQPGNAEARLGLQTITDHLISEARNAVQAKQFDEAKAILEGANAIRPDATDIQMAGNELDRARIGHEKHLADEKARMEKLDATVAEALSVADEGKVTETLGLIEQARTLAAREDTITGIKNRLYLSLETQAALSANAAKLAVKNSDTGSARQAINKARDLKDKLSRLNLPKPQLTEAEQIQYKLTTARLAAEQGYMDMSLENLQQAKSLGAKETDMDSVKKQIRTDLEAQAARATKAVKQAMQDNDTEGARQALQQAKDIKAQLDKLN